MNFRYEQLPDLCFYGGLFGHTEKGCGKRKSDVAASCVIVGRYGLWMKTGNLQVVNIEREAIQTRVKRLIAITNQREDKHKEATTQGGQPAGLTTEEKCGTILGGMREIWSLC